MTSIELYSNLRLPHFLDPSYWQRHELSKEDVCYLLDCCESTTLWKLVLRYGAQIPSTAVRTSVYKQYEVLISGKSIAIELIFSKCTYCFSTTNKLVNSGVSLLQPLTPKIPNIPMYPVKESEYLRMTRSIYQINTNITRVQFLYRFLDCSWLPTQMVNVGVICVRVEPLHFECIGARSTCLFDRKIVVVYEGNYYRVTLEQVLFVEE